MATLFCACDASPTSFSIAYEPQRRKPFDHFVEGLQLTDEGFAAVGFGNEGAAAMRVDRYGDVVWSHAFGEGSLHDVALHDGGLLMVGPAVLAALSQDGLVIRSDMDGNVVWARRLPAQVNGVAIGNGGTAVITGVHELDGFVAALDAAGDVVWAKRFGDGSLTWPWRIIALPDGYAVLGATNVQDDLFVLRLGAAGEVLWSSTYGGPQEEGHMSPYRMVATRDGGFALVSSSRSFGRGGSDILVVKLDENGSVEWANTYGGAADDEGDVIVEVDDGFVILGEEMSFGEGFFAMHLDARAAVTWAKSYGADHYLNYVDGGVTPDGGLYLLSERHVANPTGFDGHDHFYFLVKTHAEGQIPACPPADIPLSADAATLTTNENWMTASDVVLRTAPVDLRATVHEVVAADQCASPVAAVCSQALDAFCNL